MAGDYMKRAELFDYVDTSRIEEERFHFLGFEFLHRLNIVRLQNELIEMKNNVLSTRCANLEEDKLTKLLDDYSTSCPFSLNLNSLLTTDFLLVLATAVRNYNYVHEARRLDKHNMERRKQRLKLKFPSLTIKYRQTRPFESHYRFLNDNSHIQKPDFLRDKLRQWLPAQLSYSTHERHYRAKEYEEGEVPMEISSFVDISVRLLVSLVAVVVLVAPMCIMAVNPSPTKSLVTSSVFMVLFACSLSFGIKTSNAETMVATATYSAVLVVFVGTNT